MTIDTDRASAQAMPKDQTTDMADGRAMSASLALARGFIAACRAHGHHPYVTGAGAFFIELRKGAAPIPDEPHHLGAHYSYPLGFDDRPYAALREDPDYVLVLIKATRETAS